MTICFKYNSYQDILDSWLNCDNIISSFRVKLGKLSFMKKYLILSALVLVSLPGTSQTIDSVHFSYAQTSQELVGFISGELLWSDPSQDIVAVNSSIIGDTVFIEVHFELCQTFPLNTYYDSLFTQSLLLSSGQKVVKVVSYLDENLDTTSCYFQANTVAMDTAYFDLDIPIGINEDHSYGAKLFPNPSHGVFRIESEHHEIELIRVLDATGREFYGNCHVGGIVDISSLPDGVYFIYLGSGSEAEVYRCQKSTN